MCYGYARYDRGVIAKGCERDAMGSTNMYRGNRLMKALVSAIVGTIICAVWFALIWFGT